MESLHCPSCGAPLPLANRFVKMVACDFCSQVALVKRGSLEATGKTAVLADLPSLLYLGATGKLRGRAFEIIGRLQYGYEDGYWHEWYLSLDDGRHGWLQEDEGRLTLYEKDRLVGRVPPFDDVRVGETVRVAGRSVFVTEKGRAQILGGEGQLAFPLLPGERIDFIDGQDDDVQVSLEYAPDEVELMTGFAVDRDRLQVDEPDYF